MSTHPPRPYLTKLPPEIRLMIYSYLFSTYSPEEQPSVFLAPLLTCRLVHKEAFPIAFRAAIFYVFIRSDEGPFFSPQILLLRHSKLQQVRNITIKWSEGWGGQKHIDRHISTACHLLHELAHLASTLRLSTLTITTPNYKHHTESLLGYQICLYEHSVRKFGRTLFQYQMSHAACMDHVGKIVWRTGINPKRDIDDHRRDLKDGDTWLDDPYALGVGRQPLQFTPLPYERWLPPVSAR